MAFSPYLLPFHYLQLDSFGANFSTSEEIVEFSGIRAQDRWHAVNGIERDRAGGGSLR